MSSSKQSRLGKETLRDDGYAMHTLALQMRSVSVDFREFKWKCIYYFTILHQRTVCIFGIKCPYKFEFM